MIEIIIDREFINYEAKKRLCSGVEDVYLLPGLRALKLKEIGIKNPSEITMTHSSYDYDKDEYTYQWDVSREMLADIRGDNV